MFTEFLYRLPWSTPTRLRAALYMGAELDRWNLHGYPADIIAEVAGVSESTVRAMWAEGERNGWFIVHHEPPGWPVFEFCEATDV